MKRIILMAALACLGKAQAAELWNWNTGAQGTLMSYNGSQQRKAMNEAGILFSGDYLDNGGFTLGFTQTGVHLKNAAPDINQNALFASVRINHFLDRNRGEIMLRADGYRVKNNDSTGFTDNARAAALQTGYVASDKQYYYDLGYARSHYFNGFDVRQYTPTASFAVLDSFGWLQMRGYLITFSDPAQTQGLPRTRALEAKFNYWLAKGRGFKPDSLQFSALGGKRLFAVDMDGGYVGNLSDLQTAGLALGMTWTMGTTGKLLLLAGQNRYENLGLGNRYLGNFLYANWSAAW